MAPRSAGGSIACAPAEAAPRVDSAIAHAGGPTAPGAVEWLPPRRAEPEPQSAPPGGPSLFAGDAPAPVVRSQNSIGVDDWSRPSTESFGAPPAAPWSAQPWSAQRWPSAAVESTYQPVARDVGGGFDTHVVTDGDTLPLLAERRLGDASRAAEIFQLNRELLESPDLLPIGVVLRLPRESRRPSPTAGAMRDRAPGPTPFSTVSVNPGAGFATPAFRDPRPTSESRLVPVGGSNDPPPREPEARFRRELSW